MSDYAIESCIASPSCPACAGLLPVLLYRRSRYLRRHSGESRNPVLSIYRDLWTPSFDGVTTLVNVNNFCR
jgi:hypothetical protein